ncbi:MAG: sel1 repeat family protein [Candidatus Gastranaerophilales bacterium]|nr:sel1 repeat family protein [Candidatus Gastranaerophilales bacterium]
MDKLAKKQQEELKRIEATFETFLWTRAEKLYQEAYGALATPDYERGVRLMQEFAEEVYAPAVSQMGTIYYEGNRVEKNTVIAAEWWRKAAVLGDAKAQNNLGVMYALGEGGVEQDAVIAVEWCRKSAEQGYAVAQCNLGARYSNGKGVEQDKVKAAEWYRKAAEQGYAKAQYNLGVKYENGEGVERDQAKAAEWYRKAAEQGHASAQRALER